METKPRICLLLVVLLGLSWVLPADATDDEASDYLPLAVGNSWTYGHDYYDLHNELDDIERYPAYYEAPRDESTQLHKFTITVRGTEVIDGKTYYVLSDMPANWPPAPPHFIAGKKLRWAGTHLMERTADGEQAIFRFDGATDDYSPTDSHYGGYLNFRFEESKVYRTEYAIPTTEGDNRVEVEAGLKPVPWYVFQFYGNDVGGRMCVFLAGYGCNLCGWGVFGSDVFLFFNELTPLRAVIDGTSVEFADALVPTNISSSSWGQVKKEVH